MFFSELCNGFYCNKILILTADQFEILQGYRTRMSCHVQNNMQITVVHMNAGKGHLLPDFFIKTTIVCLAAF